MAEVAESELPTWGEVREKMQDLAESRGDWAGYPLPIDDLALNLAPTFPYPDLNGSKLNDFGSDEKSEDVNDVLEAFHNTLLDQIELINSWYSHKINKEVMIFKNNMTGEIGYHLETYGSGDRLTLAVNTLGASRAWDVSSELRAVMTLQNMISKSAFEYYVLTGGFLETSKRSGVTYFFRKLRPTIALKDDSTGNMKILSALCLHPIGHYQNSFAGVMVPTDDVIAHLQMMRADEHKFWAKANQHESYMPNSGV